MRDGGLLKTTGLIIGGDLNFTISAREVWGSARLDPDADYFHDIFRVAGLIDVEPAVIRPTWQNGRGGSDGIGKRLDWFIVDSDLLELAHSYRSWVVPSKISDHFPIVFQWELEGERIHYPFKFNATWLSMEDFDVFVKTLWRSFRVDVDLSPMRRLVLKLRLLKAGVKN